MKKLLLIFFVFGLFLRSTLFGQSSPEIFVFEEKIKSLGSFVQYLEDKENRLGIEDLQKTEYKQKFKTANDEVLNLGNLPYTIWLKIEIDPKSLSPMSYLIVGNPMLDKVSFFYPKSPGDYEERKAGASLPASSKEIQVNPILFSLHKDTPPTSGVFYLKIKSNYPLEIPLSIGGLRQILEQEHRKDLAFGAYLGIMMIMAFYNLFIFFLVRDRIYVYYFLFIFNISIFYLHLKGYSFHLFWGELPALNFYTPAYSSIVTILMALFASRFLNTKHYAPWLDKGFFVFIAVFAAMILLNLSGDYTISAQISQLGALLLALYALGTAVRVLIAGNPMAKFYLIAWVIYLVSVVIFILQVTSAIPSTPFTSHSVFFGTATETLLLSFALAYRINLLKKEKEAVQFENVKILQEQNTVLEVKVRERTEELSALNEELSQQQEEIMVTNENLGKLNNTLQSTAKRLRASFNAAKTIQEAALPHEEDLRSFFKEYFLVYRPKDIVSGDFYWIKKLDNCVIIVAADCTGHGVPGAFMTLIANNLLDKIVLVKQKTDPAEILSELHQEIQSALKQALTGNNSGMDATVLCLQKGEEKDDSKLLFAGAKHDMICYDTQSQTFMELKGQRKAIGGDQNENIQFTTQTVLLPKGSVIYTGTDGYEDQNDYKRNKLGRQKFMELIKQYRQKTLPQQGQALEDFLNTHMKGTEQRDDILLLGIRV